MSVNNPFTSYSYLPPGSSYLAVSRERGHQVSGSVNQATLFALLMVACPYSSDDDLMLILLAKTLGK